MAVVIYKNGKTQHVAPELLQFELDAGWSLVDDSDPELSNALLDNDDNGVADTVENEEVIRQKAKELGIKSYHNKKLDKLVKEIEDAGQDQG